MWPHELPLFLCYPDQPPFCSVLFTLKREMEQRSAIWGLERCTFYWTVPLIFMEIKARPGRGMRPDSRDLYLCVLSGAGIPGHLPCPVLPGWNEKINGACVKPRTQKTRGWALILRTLKTGKGTQKTEEWALTHMTQTRENATCRRWAPTHRMKL